MIESSPLQSEPNIPDSGSVAGRTGAIEVSAGRDAGRARITGVFAGNGITSWARGGGGRWTSLRKGRYKAKGEEGEK
jgi:hypothetical protein